MTRSRVKNDFSVGIDDGADANAITINSSEKVGIGTSSPQEKLHVYSTSSTRVEVEATTNVAAFKATNNQGSYAWYVNSSADKFHLWDFTDNVDRLTLDGAGNIGIGTTSPSKPLEISKTNGGAVIRLNNPDSTVSSAESLGSIEWQSNDASTPGGTGTQGIIKVVDTNTYGNAYAMTFTIANSGNSAEELRIDSDGLKFNGDTAAANGLDDYEEGTWTPYLQGYGQSEPMSQTYSSQLGLYRKVGNLIYVSYRITMTNKGNMSGNYVLLKGLPHTIGGTTYTGGYGGINYFNYLSTSVSNLWWEIGAGTTNSMWLAYRSTAGTGSSYMNASGISNTFYMTGSAVYYTS